MRVLALGGAGSMGAVAARTVAAGGVEQIVIADRDRAAAGRIARELADAPVPVCARRVDVTDGAELRDALHGADLVLNTVGPYFRFGLAVLRAAIDTGTHYLDICDDWEPTVAMLELDAEARAAGVTAVIGMGASPGVSNLLAATAVAPLDSVRDVYTAWPVDATGDVDDSRRQLIGADGSPTAAAVHWMQQSSGNIKAVRAGSLTEQRPLRPVALELPGGRRGTAYTVGHPEPITLHRTLGLTGDSASLMVVRPSTVAYLDVLRRDIDAGGLTNAAAARRVAEPHILSILRSLPRALVNKGPATLPPFFAAAFGERQGRETAVLAHLDPAAGIDGLLTDMARATGIPLALGMSQVVDGTARRAGVHPPEAVIDRERFFADLDRELGRTGSPPLIVVEHECR
ncbi:saccharopine dehydrogenase family protein [Mycolicibacterium mageritense]|uniref:saccharopine dehydrogenase family protein n=1 Tax=Mycolicibacterium mageritense TaxID=53462 RepID=UPI0011D4532E|nr:saccharopine dehydrogenase NADP-binding domain-containing protein [Mycolicibacterium mageritense]MBN3456373.1 saccharopine dehydrogenase NADP-binding domain-containing protein [Mycobacterium sp. DSM 3803]TXI65257.1 MAG: saccharopine dehydrogenase [Mycolicibacterium mageritense]